MLAGVSILGGGRFGGRVTFGRGMRKSCEEWNMIVDGGGSNAFLFYVVVLNRLLTHEFAEYERVKAVEKVGGGSSPEGSGLRC